MSIRDAAHDLDADDHVFAAKGNLAVSAVWESDRVLVIRADEGAFLKKAHRWRDVEVRYRFVSKRPPARVSATTPIQPSAGAREVSPGVFIATIREGAPGTPPVETVAGFTIYEAIYDANGNDVGGSVPSMAWGSMPESSRRQLAGMRQGEIRRI